MDTLSGGLALAVTLSWFYAIGTSWKEEIVILE
jgi:hypothetical protein